MEKTLVTTGKTIDLAIETALNQLGLDRDSVSVLVLAQAKTGFLGFGAQPAKVQVTYEAPDPVPEKPKVALSSASRSKPKAAAPVKKPEPAPANPAPVKEAPKAEVPQKEAPKAEKSKAPKAPKEHKEPRVPKTPKEPTVYAPAEPGSVEEKIETFITGLLTHMGSSAVPHCVKAEEGTYKVDLVGDDLGYLIGRRGDTLDAIQHLCNYSINRNVEGHIRINVDAEDYRRKREDSLSRYARKKAVEHLGAVYVVVSRVYKAYRMLEIEKILALRVNKYHAALSFIYRVICHLDNAL